MKKQGIKVALQIFLLVVATISFAYMVHETDKPADAGKISKFGILLVLIGNLLFGEKGLVSALENPASTCIQSKEGEICQEYASSECDAQCGNSCIPSTADKVAECELGTCYDAIEGICTPSSPKAKCDATGGKWYDDRFANILECQKGCCVFGDKTKFTTERECAKISERTGIKKEFKPETNTELECLVLGKIQEEGACTFKQGNETRCKFITKVECLQINGEFHSGLLCSNPELKTICKKQARTGCIEGRDEVYWIDSCGNRENIWSGNPTASHNNGKILAKNESCILGTAGNPLAKQETCGNCNHFAGSACGTPGKNDARAAKSEFVCRDLNCEDENGNFRHNGESWCEFTSAIGVDAGNKYGTFISERSVDTPGSKYFRKICLNGEIRTEPCADFRGEVCTELEYEGEDEKFSASGCRINKWQECISYNTEVEGKGKALKDSQDKRDDKCGKNADCFVKQVNVDKGFKFNFCTPRYPPGFDLKTKGESAKSLCGTASQKCTVIYVKTTSGWKCVANCDCETKKFTEQMNDLCISLGDCGAEVNYIGKLTENYKVKNAPKLDKKYLEGLTKYKDPVEGQKAEAGNLSEFFGQYGIPGGLGDAKYVPQDNVDVLGTILRTAVGSIGTTLAVATFAPFLYPTAIKAAGMNVGSILMEGLGSVTGVFGGAEAAAAHVGAVYAGGIGTGSFWTNLGATAAFSAVAAIFLKMSGVGAGLSPVQAMVITSLPAIGAGVAALLGKSTLAGGLYGLIAAIVIILIMKFLGIGKTKKVIVQFTCQPWQPPAGGSDCEKCGEGQPCSRYQCEMLGQTCEFINEGTGQELCADAGKNDTLQPVIEPNKKLYELTNYSLSEETKNGFVISAPKECIKAYESIPIAITIDEPAQCKMDVVKTDSFEEMESDFGESNLFVYNHTMLFSIPDLSSLELPEYKPNAKKDYTLFVRCQDRRGNKNEKEYAIKFCIKPGEDVTPPVITGVEPAGLTLKFDATEHNASIFTNEPAQCKWDYADVEYKAMKNEFACLNDLEDIGANGWECNALFQVNDSENKFYVRCRDQPWLNEGNEKINPNTESYLLIFKKSSSELKITSITPSEGVLRFGVEPATVEIIAETEGGVDGTATCEYSVGARYIRFQETYGKIHKQVFNSVSAGDKVFPVRCSDSAGNVAIGEAAFRVDIDADAPVVTRAYISSGILSVITNENASCAFSTNSEETCGFAFENGTAMSGEGIEHSGSIEEGLAHYVKCKDSYGHVAGECSIIVRPLEF